MTTYRKHGITAYELLYIKPHVVKIQDVKTDWNKIAGFVLLIGIVVGILGTVFEPNLGVAHAEEPQLSDTQQEKMYCQLWKQGAEVSGGSEDAISQHCARFN